MRELLNRARERVGRAPGVGRADPDYQAAYDDVAAHTNSHRRVMAPFWEAEAAALAAERRRPDDG